MNYEKILCEFQNFIKAYLSLEHKQHRILDLNLSEVHLLKVAEQNPNYTLIEYAEKLKVSRSAITQLVNLLEKKDCVKKEKANKKSFVLELTSKGEIVCNKHDEEHKKIENDLRRIFKKYDCIFFEQLSELMSDITSTWENTMGCKIIIEDTNKLMDSKMNICIQGLKKFQEIKIILETNCFYNINAPMNWSENTVWQSEAIFSVIQMEQYPKKLTI